MSAPLSAPPNPLASAIEQAQRDVEHALRTLALAEDERMLDERWTNAAGLALALTQRPAKRIRPLLLLAGHGLAQGGPSLPSGVVQFAAGLELLHSFLLIHDDVADRAQLRRGGPALHLQLGAGRQGDDLAVVVGDHLFARSLELMLSADSPRATEATRYFLGVCRHTAVGQFLDLSASQVLLGDSTLFQVLKVAHLKTARYGFAGPLVAGAILGGGAPQLISALERAGRQAGLAFQLRDDLLGLFGDPSVSGKSSDSDFQQGKVTFPVVAAYIRADEAGRRRLETLWGSQDKSPQAQAEALDLVRRYGGDTATDRVISRATRASARALASVDPAMGLRSFLENFFSQLAHRSH